MKCFRLLFISALLSAIYLIAEGQVNYYGNSLTSQTGYYPSALGFSNTANGKYSLAGGTNSKANGECSFGFGSSAVVGENGFGAVALGFYVESNTPASFTLGRFLKSNASAAFVIGSGNGSSGYLTNQIGSSLIVGFNSQYPTLFISNSPGGLMTGKIGIGNVTNPTSKLHLLSDDGEAAELKLEHRTTGLRQYAQIYIGSHTIRAGNAENMVFTTPATKSFAFMTGNVGIGTNSPVQKLDIDGNICLRNNGGIGSWSDNSLGFVTNGKIRMTILNTGNVGLATIAPLQPLHVNGNVLLTGKNASLLFADDPPANGNWGKWGIEYESGGLNFWKPYEGPASDDPKANAYNYALFLRDDGNVGIGMATPEQKLDVNGNIRIRGDRAIGTWSSNSLSFITNSLPRLNIISDGKIGIGTPEPSEKLDVEGNIRLRGSASLGTWSDNSFYVITNSQKRITVASNGNVGIGTDKPTDRLSIADAENYRPLNFHIGVTQDVFNNAYNNGTTNRVINGPAYAFSFSESRLGFKVAATGSAGTVINWNEAMVVNNLGNVGIGILTPEAQLHVKGNSKIEGALTLTGGLNTPQVNVNGTVYAKQVRVKQNVPSSDHVFKPDYYLMPLTEVAAYIKSNGHLPEVPSAQSFQENGYLLGDMDDILLRKVEELTLHLIELNKKLERLTEENLRLQKNQN